MIGIVCAFLVRTHRCAQNENVHRIIVVSSYQPQIDCNIIIPIIFFFKFKCSIICLLHYLFCYKRGLTLSYTDFIFIFHVCSMFMPVLCLSEAFGTLVLNNKKIKKCGLFNIMYLFLYFLRIINAIIIFSVKIIIIKSNLLIDFFYLHRIEF